MISTTYSNTIDQLKNLKRQNKNKFAFNFGQLHSALQSYNPGQNLLGQMFFALKEAFPACKLLPFTANAPLLPIAMLVAERRHTCQLIYEIFISFQHCSGAWGDFNSKFHPKYKVYHEFCLGLSERVENFRGA